jgi:hypothetical protein
LPLTVGYHKILDARIEIGLALPRFMKKTLRLISVFLALSASASIALHAGHFDKDHVKNTPAHQCGLCKSVANADVPVSTSFIPVFVESPHLLVLKPAVFSASLLSGGDPRGPPLA